MTRVLLGLWFFISPAMALSGAPAQPAPDHPPQPEPPHRIGWGPLKIEREGQTVCQFGAKEWTPASGRCAMDEVPKENVK